MGEVTQAEKLQYILFDILIDINMNIQQIAESFSSHKFESTYQFLSAEIMWHMIGGNVIEGKVAVINSCNESAKYLSNVQTTFKKYKTFAGDNFVVIDSTAEYVDDKKVKSEVSSCDIYEFEGEKIISITSYNIEIPQKS